MTAIEEAQTEEVPLTEAPLAAPENKRGVVRYGWNFTRRIAREDRIWSSMRGLQKSGLLIAQAVTGILFVLSLPIVVEPMGVAACVAAIGVGIYGISYGFRGTWDTLEKFCNKTFKTFNPLNKLRLRAARIAKKIGEKPLMQKLSRRIENLANKTRQSKFFKSRLVQKAVNSRFARIFEGGLTQKQRDVFLAAVTVQGSLAAITILSIGIASHLLAVPALTAASCLTVGMGVRAALLGMNAAGLFRGSQYLFKTYRRRKRAKRAARLKPTLLPDLPAPPAQEAKAELTFSKAAPAFNTGAGKEANAKDPATGPAVLAPRPATLRAS